MSEGKGIARIWRGRTVADKGDFYETYLYENGVKKLKALGATSVQMLRENRGEECHFMVISWWPTREAMTSWAGDDPNRIRHLERDRELLVELPDAVEVMDLVRELA